MRLITPPFASCIPSFKDDDDLVATGHDPVLELYELSLEAEQFAKVPTT